METLETTDPARACWTIWGADPVVSFWRRRMTNEAAKHLWDLRTATEPHPPMPVEISPEEPAGILNEFVELLVRTARARGIERLPRGVLLAAEDLDRTWLFSPSWEVTTSPLSGLPPKPDIDIMRADLGDLALFLWERANPWDLPDRYRIEGSDAALQVFGRTRVHL